MVKLNTRLKHQSEQFWIAEKTTKGGGALKRPAPLCVFFGSQNYSNCCLSLIFVGFIFLILCWLAGANDEVYFWKFIPNYNFDNFGLCVRRATLYNVRSGISNKRNNAI